MGVYNAWVKFMTLPFVSKNKKAIFFLLTFTIVFYCFFEISPVTYDKYYILITIIAGVIATISFSIFLFSFLQKDPKDDPYLFRGDKGGYILGFLIIGFFFSFSIYLLWFQFEKKQKLIQNGEYAIAIILGHREMDLRKADFSYITVGFYDKTNKYHKVQYDIGASVVKKYRNKRYIPIVYSKEYPELITSISGHESFKRLARINSRNTEFSDLAYLLDHPELSNKEIVQYLNSINQYWENDEYSKNEFSNIFTPHKIILNRGESVQLSYPLDLFTYDDFYKNFIELGFVRDTSVKGKRVFRNDKYEIEYERNNTFYSGDDSEIGYIQKYIIRKRTKRK